MEYGFSVMMLALAAGLLVYAGILAALKDPMLIPRHYAAKMKNGKAYTIQIAKVVCLVACAPALSGLVGFFHIAAALALLPVGLVFFMWLGIRISNKKG